MAGIVALLHGPDRPGLVARTSGWIFQRGGNILHADQHRDAEEGIFFQRIEWQPAGSDVTAEAQAFQAFGQSLGMHVATHPSEPAPRVAVFVSKADHCFHDLALRWRAGDFNGILACVVSNHGVLREAAASYGLPFHEVAVDPAAKACAEERQLAIVREHGCELIVLARYMQVLSGEFLRAWALPVINIHHSFLPAFAGARPYHQAYARGVKLIGATAHYATEELDQGPIIHQDVVRVTHRHGVGDLIRKGRDLERVVLAQAVRWHLDRRVLAYGRKTVVFD